MNSNTSNSSGRMLLIDCCRGIAALLVVLQHGIYAVSKDKYFGVDPLGGMFEFGARGVDFFFVLSGFVITYVHWSDLGRPQRIGLYLRKRFVRIYPLLWVVAIPMLVASWFMSSEYLPSGGWERAEAVATSITLLPSPLHPLPDVAWTLRHEVLFYAVYCLALWRPRFGAAVLGAWAALCGLHMAGVFPSNWMTDFYLSPYNLEFLLGVACGYYVRTRTVPMPRLLACVGLIGFVIAGLTIVPVQIYPSWTPNPTTALQTTEFALASALAILGLSQISIAESKVPKLLLVMGAASYAMYLVHVPVISAAIKVTMIGKQSLGIGPWTAFLLVSAAGALAGICLHLLIELPLLRLARRLVLREPKHSAVQLPTSSIPQDPPVPCYSSMGDRA